MVFIGIAANQPQTRKVVDDFDEPFTISLAAAVSHVLFIEAITIMIIELTHPVATLGENKILYVHRVSCVSANAVHKLTQRRDAT